MNKQTFLNELSSLLKTRGVEEIDEIIADYDTHFTYKTADGYTEEEIAAKLGKPQEIAQQFGPVSEKRTSGTGGRVLRVIGLAFTDVFVISFFLLMGTWVLVLGVTAVSSVFGGIGLLVSRFILMDIILVPVMPYAGAIFLGITIIALGVLFAVATVICWALTTQLIKSYKRWHKNTNSDSKYPPLSMHPIPNAAARRKLRTVALIALVVFGVTFIIGYIVLSISAGALEFWHVWHWFQ